MATPEPGASVSFVLGTGRCGSTLFHELLVGHPDLAFVSNLEDRFGVLGARPSLNRALYRFAGPAVTRKGRLRFAPSEAYLALAREVSPALVDPFRDLTAADLTPATARRLQAFFERHRGEYPHLSHKFTGWPRAGLLDAAFPGTRFVHVHRDGRAVVGSWTQMTWWRGHRGEAGWHFGPLDDEERELWESTDLSLVALAALGWRRLMRAHREARDERPDRWLDVSFAELVDERDESVDRAVRFLGLTPDPRHHRLLERWEMETGPLDRYRKDLTATQIDEIERVAGDELARWGYL